MNADKVEVMFAALEAATGLSRKELIASRDKFPGDPPGWMEHMKTIAAARGQTIVFVRGGFMGAAATCVNQPRPSAPSPSGTKAAACAPARGGKAS